MEDNILSSEPDVYAPIKKFSLQTFSTLAKKVSSKKKNGDVIELKNSKELFAKMLLIAKNRNLDLKEVLQYSLRPFPLSLATLEGNLVKSTKSKLLNIIENEVEEALVEHIAGENALIIDTMALLQSMKIRSTTFGELALEILTRIVQMASFSNSKRVDLIYGSQQKIPCQWQNFLAVGKNEEEIMEFLFDSWNGIICSKVNALTSNHEEADTRMLCHALHASTNYPSVIIKSPDTDVFFIALNASSVIPSNVYFETVNQKNLRIISLDKVRLHYGPQWCSAFVGLHSFTGCDSISSFYGKGKATALKVARSKDEHANTFANLGVYIPSPA
ncbi:Hypothetical predicted protein, partial [Paramuricea clavata]